MIWAQSDNVLHRFYWFESLSPAAKGRIDAKIEKNTITITTANQADIALWLSPTLVDYKKPIMVVKDGKRSEFRIKPSLQTYVDGLAATGDPALSAPVRLLLAR